MNSANHRRFVFSCRWLDCLRRRFLWNEISLLMLVGRFVSIYQLNLQLRYLYCLQCFGTSLLFLLFPFPGYQVKLSLIFIFILTYFSHKPIITIILRFILDILYIFLINMIYGYSDMDIFNKCYIIILVFVIKL